MSPLVFAHPILEPSSVGSCMVPYAHAPSASHNGSYVAPPHSSDTALAMVVASPPQRHVGMTHAPSLAYGATPGSHATLTSPAGPTDFERFKALAMDARDAMLSEFKVVLLVYLIGLARRRRRGLIPTLSLVRNYVIFKLCYWFGLPQPTAALNALAAKHRRTEEGQAHSHNRNRSRSRSAAGTTLTTPTGTRHRLKKKGGGFLFEHGFSLKALRCVLVFVCLFVCGVWWCVVWRRSSDSICTVLCCPVP